MSSPDGECVTRKRPAATSGKSTPEKHAYDEQNTVNGPVFYALIKQRVRPCARAALPYGSNIESPFHKRPTIMKRTEEAPPPFVVPADSVNGTCTPRESVGVASGFPETYNPSDSLTQRFPKFFGHGGFFPSSSFSCNPKKYLTLSFVLCRSTKHICTTTCMRE